jgi:hypothetical protein
MKLWFRKKQQIARMKTDQKTCPICGLVFLSRKQKTEHLRLHRPARPVKKSA